jgi:AcrR family transcriptional regulator
VELFEHVTAHATLYARMLGAHGSARFAARLREALAEALLQRFRDGARPRSADGVPLPVHAAYLAGALTGVIAHCAGDEQRQAADTAAATWRLLAAPPVPFRT